MMPKFSTVIIYLFSLFVIFAAPDETHRDNRHTFPVAASGFNDPEALKKILTHYDEWQSVHYQLGANSRQAIEP